MIILIILELLFGDAPVSTNLGNLVLQVRVKVL